MSNTFTEFIFTRFFMSNDSTSSYHRDLCMIASFINRFTTVTKLYRKTALISFDELLCY